VNEWRQSMRQETGQPRVGMQAYFRNTDALKQTPEGENRNQEAAQATVQPKKRLLVMWSLATPFARLCPRLYARSQ